MNCQDNSRLKVPLPELCKTTDIGCVPMTSGKPDCPPEADQLPLAYDKNSQTLWLFNCESRQWMPFSKFTLAELQEVSLDNIRNICELLKIPVYYNPGGGTVQGSMPLAEFGKELLKCQSFEGKVAVLPSGLTSFTIQGLDSLEPFYVRWENLTVSGDGTSSSPLVVKGQDPITKWPKKTEADVDSAVQPMLAANLDGEMVQVPYPKKPCAYPKLTKAEVEAANEVLLIGCVDEANVKIPYPDQPQDYDPLTDDQVDALPPGTGKWLIAVIDGKVYRIPFPKEPCEYDRATGTELVTGTADIIACLNGKKVKIPLSDLATGIDASMEGVCTYDRATSAELMAGTADVIACLDGKRVRVPLADLTRAVEDTSETSGCTLPFASKNELKQATTATFSMCIDGAMRQVIADENMWTVIKFPDITIVREIPNGPPEPGTSQFRIDCDGSLWIWDATSQDWLHFVQGNAPPGREVSDYSSISGTIADPCKDVIVRAWYQESGTAPDDCEYRTTKMNMTNFVNVLDKCGLASDTELNTEITNLRTEVYEYFRNIAYPLQYSLDYWENSSSRGMTFSNVQLDSDNFASFSVHRQAWESGSGTVVQAYRPDREGGGPATRVPVGGAVTYTNTKNHRVLLVCYPSVSLSLGMVTNDDISIVIHMMVTDDPTLSDALVRQGRTLIDGTYYYSLGGPTQQSAICSNVEMQHPVNRYYRGPVNNPTSSSLAVTSSSVAGVPTIFVVEPNTSKNLYLRGWCSMYRISGQSGTIPIVHFPFVFSLDVSVFPY